MLFKGPMQCFSQQVVMNKRYLPNPEIKRRFVLSFTRKNEVKTAGLRRNPFPKKKTSHRAEDYTQKTLKISFRNHLQV